MAEVITMPRLSDTMTEGKVAKWHFKVGDSIKEGDILAEIETDKAVQDFESEFDGVLLHVGTEENNAAPVDTILAIIGEKEEDISALLQGTPVTEEKKEAQAETPVQETAKATESFTLPDNVEVITVPRLSDTMEEGKVMKWNFKEGDTIKEGDLIAEIETDKAVQDFESEFTGTLLFQGVKEGDSAKVDSILAIIGEKGTDISAVVAHFSNGAAAPKKETVEAPKVAETQTEDPKAVASTQHNSNGRIFISPLAKKLAEEKGISIQNLQGSGENGRIIKNDVLHFNPSQAHSNLSSGPIIQGIDSETPNSQVRNIIAKRLSESKFTAPHYYLNVEVDMDNAITTRVSINSIPDTKISFNDMVVKASALALKQHKQVNSSWQADKIIHHGNINIGVAVAIEDGLVVPVLKNTDQLNFQTIAASVKDLAVRARDRKLKADEMEGSSFSISNLGMFGIESFTSIINQPNSCILSVGAIIQKPVVKEGNIVVGNIMKLTLACDHRVVDGATGAQFLQTLKDYLENPIKMVM